MKQLCFFIALAFVFSCTKEKFSEPVAGTWTIIQSNIGTGSGSMVQSYTPSSEITIEFGANSNLVLTGSNPGLATSPLWKYNKYQLLPGNKIRFFQSSGADEMEAFVTVDGQLYLDYLWARCGYQEKFLKIK